MIEASGRTQIVVNGWHHSGGYDFVSGRELWRLKGGGDIPVPTPVFANGLVYLTSAHGQLRPMRAIRPDATGDITASDPAGSNAATAWVHPRQGNYMQTPIAVSNRVYGCSTPGVLTCFDATTGRFSTASGSADRRKDTRRRPFRWPAPLLPGETAKCCWCRWLINFNRGDERPRGFCMATPQSRTERCSFARAPSPTL